MSMINHNNNHKSNNNNDFGNEDQRSNTNDNNNNNNNSKDIKITNVEVEPSTLPPSIEEISNKKEGIGTIKMMDHNNNNNNSNPETTTTVVGMKNQDPTTMTTAIATTACTTNGTNTTSTDQIGTTCSMDVVGSDGNGNRIPATTTTTATTMNTATIFRKSRTTSTSKMGGCDHNGSSTCNDGDNDNNDVCCGNGTSSSSSSSNHYYYYDTVPDLLYQRQLSTTITSKIRTRKYYKNHYHNKRPCLDVSLSKEQKQQQHPDWLLSSPTTTTTTSSLTSTLRIDPQQLSSRIAWNPERLRNMILVVGPNTPASVCWNDIHHNSDDDDNEYEVVDDDDETDTDEDDEEDLGYDHDEDDEEDDNHHHFAYGHDNDENNETEEDIPDLHHDHFHVDNNNSNDDDDDDYDDDSNNNNIVIDKEDNDNENERKDYAKGTTSSSNSTSENENDESSSSSTSNHRVTVGDNKEPSVIVQKKDKWMKKQQDVIQEQVPNDTTTILHDTGAVTTTPTATTSAEYHHDNDHDNDDSSMDDDDTTIVSKAQFSPCVDVKNDNDIDMDITPTTTTSTKKTAAIATNDGDEDPGTNNSINSNDQQEQEQNKLDTQSQSCTTTENKKENAEDQNNKSSQSSSGDGDTTTTTTNNNNNNNEDNMDDNDSAVVVENRGEVDSNNHNEQVADDDDNDDDNDDEESNQNQVIYHRTYADGNILTLEIRRAIRDTLSRRYVSGNRDSSGTGSATIRRRRTASDNSNNQNQLNHRVSLRPSIRHGGCINTACWLTCPWRLSSSYDAKSFGSNSYVTTSTNNNNNECPTQMITSGDDKMIKFWDVRKSMGVTNPLPGGYDTLSPFSYYNTTTTNNINYSSNDDDDDDNDDDDENNNKNQYQSSYEFTKKKWKRHYRQLIDCCEEEEHSTSSGRGSTHNHHPKNPTDFVTQTLHGSVNQLLSIHSGHRGNVFHVTPIHDKPGHVVTCGADGYLRLTDIIENKSSIVVEPFGLHLQLQEHSSFFLRPSSMAFSHTMLTANTGLLCSARGLHHFDIRVPPCQQSKHSIYQPYRHRNIAPACKACAIWNPQGTYNNNPMLMDSDPTYIFAGGSNSVVDLFDMRLMDGSSSNNNSGSRKVLQMYKPRQLSKESGKVSVSGLDVTKDGKELLVSYEVDQIYTFPIFPQITSSAGPTLQEIDEAANENTNENLDNATFIPELASYGGHLNRLTFLKNPKYAGPNDEYICTGSDSGHAWIYEKRTGTVVSLLGTDSCTCNGIIPHPTLPYFITYGIESTAKVWRATLPVVDDSKQVVVDTSSVGRRKCFTMDSKATTTTTLSPVTLEWDGIETFMNRLDPVPTMMPDVVVIPPKNDEADHFGEFFSSSTSTTTGGGIAGDNTPKIGNALQILPSIIRQNKYECYKSVTTAAMGHNNNSLEQPIENYSYVTSIQRLKYQADRLGVTKTWSLIRPWEFRVPNHIGTSTSSTEAATGTKPTSTTNFPLSFIVPDHPSDWILLDKNMTLHPLVPGRNFNTKDYGDLLREGFPHEAVFTTKDHNNKNIEDNYITKSSEGVVVVPWLPPNKVHVDQYNDSLWPVFKQSTIRFINGSGGKNHNKNQQTKNTDVTTSTTKESDDDIVVSDFVKRSRLLFLETVSLLKQDGNVAMEKHQYHTACRHYDKAIQYCAVAFFRYHEGTTNLKHLTVGHHAILPTTSQGLGKNKKNGNQNIAILLAVWSPLLRVLITTKLNLALLLLKPSVLKPTLAGDQCKHVLKLLAPFTRKECYVVGMYKRKLHVLSSTEPSSTYQEAKALQAKAFCRLGCAEYEVMDYESALKHYEAAVKCLEESTSTKTPTTTTTDTFLLKRLNEAKRMVQLQKKRERKRYKKFMEQDD